MYSTLARHSAGSKLRIGLGRIVPSAAARIDHQVEQALASVGSHRKQTLIGEMPTASATRQIW